MNEKKGLLSSITAWGSFGSLASAFALWQQVQPEVAIIAAGVSALVTILGRIKATAKIVKL
jgi:hypothetical protein